MANRKKIIGIIGGIGSGKSTVADAFADEGCAVIKADMIAHEVLEKAEVIDQIVKAFGERIVTDEKIDRKKLSESAFSSEKQLETLNSIIHPKVLKEIDKLIEIYSRDTNIRAIVLDVPLLLEVGWENKCNFLVFIDCDFKTRAERAEKKGVGAEEIKKRENFQFSLDKKSKLAHYTINNNSDPGTTIDQVIRVLSAIVE